MHQIGRVNSRSNPGVDAIATHTVIVSLSRGVCLLCRHCPWATSEDAYGSSTQKANQQGSLSKHVGGKLNGAYLHRHILPNGQRPMACPIPPGSVNYSVCESRDISYPPTAVTTRVEGTMTPSEQAEVEARITALEAEARRMPSCRQAMCMWHTAAIRIHTCS